MAQNEMMLRLLKRDKSIPVGFKHVGWMFISKGKVYYQPRCDLFQPMQCFRDTTEIKYDSFELGIKVGDDWCFGEYVYDKHTNQYRFVKSNLGE